MAIHPLPQTDPKTEAQRVAQAQAGDRAAFAALTEPWRKPLFAYIYRMVTHRQDAEDLLQDVWLRAMKAIGDYRGEARFKTWLFGIATHACLDHLRTKNRWRVETQLLGEQQADADPAALEALGGLMAQPDFAYEIREHIAFCFACVGRTLPPEEQAALLLREVLGFTAQEAAAILEISEPVFRHRLAAARKSMIESYEGLCQLINKTGRCYQCRSLREFAPEGQRGEDLVQIQVAADLAVTPENLFEERLRIVRQADLEEGRTHALHELFFTSLTQQEEGAD